MKNASCTIIIKVSTSWGELRETPVSVGWAWDDVVGTWDGVEKGISRGTITIGVSARDCWRLGLEVDDIVVDGSDLGLLSGGLEPGGEVVKSTCGSSVCSRGLGNSVCYSGLERGGLSSGARAVGDSTLGDSRIWSTLLEVTLGDVLTGNN